MGNKQVVTVPNYESDKGQSDQEIVLPSRFNIALFLSHRNVTQWIALY